MALFDTITRFFSRNRTREMTTLDDTDQRVMRIGRGTMNARTRFAYTSDTRREQIRMARKMYQQDTRAKAIIKALARDAVKGGFQIEFGDGTDEKAQAVAEDLVERLKLARRLDDWVRLTLRDGDSMIEVGVNRQREIAKVTRKPALNTFRYSNDRDEFDDPMMAFWYSPNGQIIGDPIGRNDVIWFAEWQIIHGRWDHDEGERYGQPLLAPAEKSYKRLSEGETDVAIKRKTRSGIKFVHKIGDLADEAAIEEYIERNKAALDDPFAAAADFFIAGDGNIDVLAGDANLDKIEDIRHHLDSFFLASPVPRTILGYGQDINYSVVNHQKQQYDETLDEVQTWVATQFVVPLLERQWLLSGILPERVGYEIKWPGKQVLTPQDIELLAKAIIALRAGDVPDQTIARMMSRYIPGIDPDDLIPGADELEMVRLARIAGLMGQIEPGPTE